MRKFLGFQKLIALALGFSIFGCHNPSEIGFDLGGDGNVGALYTDSVSLKYSTVLSDSSVTSNGTYILAGKTVDPVFGEMEATAFFQPSLTPQYNTSGTIITNTTTGAVLFDTLQLKNSNPIVDSLRLRLYCPGVIFGDTNAMSTFRIHRLTELAQNKNYSSTEKLNYDATPLAEFTINLPMLRNDSTGVIGAYFVKLPTDIATELINAGSTANGNNTSFVNSFRGFAIVPDAGNKAIYGFSTGYLDLNGRNSSLIPYWHFEGDTTSTLHVFNINGPRHSSIETDRSGTALANLSNANNEISFDAAGERLFLQSGTGISTKIDLSPVANIGDIKVAKAVLEFRQDPASINKLFPKSYFQVLAEVGNNNQQARNADNLLTYIGATNQSTVGSYYVLSDTTTYFNVDITQYLQRLSFSKDYNKKILLLPANVNTTSGYGLLAGDNLSRLVFLKPRLLLYYTKE